MKSVVAFFAVLVALAGCSSVPQQQRGIINDVSVSESLDAGYTIVAVDDAKVTRAEPGKSANIAPVAIVPAGLHTLSLEPKVGTAGEPRKISVTIAPNKRYRIAKQADGSLTLVEHGAGNVESLNR